MLMYKKTNTTKEYEWMDQYLASRNLIPSRIGSCPFSMSYTNTSNGLKKKKSVKDACH